LFFHGDRLYYCRSHCTHQLHIVRLLHTPSPGCFSGIIGTPPSPLALLRLNWHSSVWIGASIFHSALYTAFSVRGNPLEWVLLNHLLDLDQERHYFIPDSLPPSPFSAAQHRWAAPLDMRSSIPVGTPWPGFATLNFILHSSITISTPIAHLVHHIRHSSFPCGAHLFPPNSSYCLSNSILIHRDLISIPTFSISQIEPVDFGIQFHPLTRPESFGNTRSAFIFLALLMNCVFLRLLALMRWKIYWMTLRLCLIDIILIA